MPSEIYRDRIVNNIRYAVQESRNAQRIEHPGLTGRIRELAASCLFRPMFPVGFEIGTGKICDKDNRQSGEVDLVIYNRRLLPPVMYSDRDGIFPVESVNYAFEIKSRATASSIQDSIRKAREIVSLNYRGKSNYGHLPNYSTALTAFFAFDSDLSEKGLTELKRYTKYDPDWQEDPVIKVICIVGSGYWYFDYNTKKWEYHPATQNYDEVIDLVGNMVNTLTHSLFTVREAWLGDYVMLPRNAYTYDPSKG